jgi:hypothetical protein
MSSIRAGWIRPSPISDDAAFHVLVRQRDRRDGRLGGEIRGDPLHRDGDHLASSLVGLLAGLRLDIADDDHRISLGLVLYLLDESLFRVLGTHARDPLQLDPGPLGDPVQLLANPLDLAFLLLDRLLFPIEGGGPGVQRGLPLADPVFLLLYLGPAGFEIGIGLGAHPERLVPSLRERLSLGGFSLSLRLLNERLGPVLGGVDFLLREGLPDDVTDPCTHEKAEDETDDDLHHSPLSHLPGRLPRRRSPTAPPVRSARLETGPNPARRGRV